MVAIPVVPTQLGAAQPRPVILVNPAGDFYEAKAAAPAATAGKLGQGVDRSGTIATAGQSQMLAAANANRLALPGQNNSDNDIWYNETGGDAGPNLPGSYRVFPGQTWEVTTNQKVSVWGSVAGQRWTATETVTP